jgi:hypothetical protein
MEDLQALPSSLGLGFDLIDDDVQGLLYVSDEVNGLLHCGLHHHELTDPGRQAICNTHHLAASLQATAA